MQPLWWWWCVLAVSWCSKQTLLTYVQQLSDVWLVSHHRKASLGVFPAAGFAWAGCMCRAYLSGAALPSACQHRHVWQFWLCL